jgi:hypothetical protein
VPKAKAKAKAKAKVSAKAKAQAEAQESEAQPEAGEREAQPDALESEPLGAQPPSKRQRVYPAGLGCSKCRFKAHGCQVCKKRLAAAECGA